MGFVGHASQCVAIDSNKIGVRIESDWRGCRLERRFALEGHVGVSPGGRTEEASEKSFDMTTNLVGSKEHQKKVSTHGCFTCLVFGLMISDRNFVSLDSRTTNGAGFPPETPRI